MDDAFAEADIAEMGDCLHRFRIGVGRGNQFEQAHVARWVEKVGAEPVAAEVFAEAFADGSDRQTASVGGDQRSGLTDGFHFLQQRALQFEILNHSLDNPIDVREFCQVIFEVADGDELSEIGMEEGCGLRFLRGVEAGGGELVTSASVRVRGNDVEEVRGNTCIREVCGDAGTHGPRS